MSNHLLSGYQEVYFRQRVQNEQKFRAMKEYGPFRELQVLQHGWSTGRQWVKEKEKAGEIGKTKLPRVFQWSLKGRIVKAMVFLVVMYGCESWTIKKTEHQRIDDFELWCCRRLLRVPWTVRRSNQSILKEISPGCSLEGLMLKLILQYFGHLIQRTDSLEKALMLGKTGGRRRRGQQRIGGWMASLTQWT